MKYIISMILVLAMTIVGTINLNAQSKKDMDQFEVQVAGLGCPFCAYGLEKKMKDFKGIKKIKIDMETGDLSFLYPSEKKLSLIEVEDQVDNAGYTTVMAKVTRFDGQIEENKEAVVSADVDLNNLSKGTLFVEGTCKMCRARLSKAVKSVNGVADADWDKKTKIMSFSFDKRLTDKETIEDAIIAVGHDTQNRSAADDKYESLPACCLYERIKRDN